MLSALLNKTVPSFPSVVSKYPVVFVTTLFMPKTKVLDWIRPRQKWGVCVCVGGGGGVGGGENGVIATVLVL